MFTDNGENEGFWTGCPVLTDLWSYVLEMIVNFTHILNLTQCITSAWSCSSPTQEASRHLLPRPHRQIATFLEELQDRVSRARFFLGCPGGAFYDF